MTENAQEQAKCSDCGKDLEDPNLDGVCATRSGHEARCTCSAIYYGPGYVFPLPPGKLPGEYAGISNSPDCPFHGAAARKEMGK